MEGIDVNAKTAGGSNCFADGNKIGSCCQVESVLSVDERGQMVLPKEIRDKAGIRAGEKLALISWESEGKICCLSLIKVEELTGMVKNMLGPLMKDILQ
jgi:antitoxin PrlF